MKKNVSIVIIHYKAIEHLQKCLARLQFAGSSFETIVVDNNSEQNFHSLKKRYPTVKWIENTRNRGFSFAANQGMQVAQARWVLFLNPDVFISNNEVEQLFHYAEKERLDAVSPSFNDDRYQKPIPSIASLLSEFTPLHTLSYRTTFQKTLVGGCVLVKKKVLEELCGWDERFFLWFEDSDLTERLVDGNYRVGFAPFSVHHVGGVSVNQLNEKTRKETFFHSMEIYSRKHFTYWEQQILSRAVINRFTSQTTYPVANPGSSWVIPNIRLELLENFLITNEHFFKESELIIVSSQLNSKNIWKFRENFPSVRFIPISQNKGFSVTVNIGLRVSTTKMAGTINDDVVLNRETIPNLVKRLTWQIGSINPVIYSVNNQLESAGIKILKKGKAVPITQLPDTEVAVVPATNAACVLYNLVALAQVGLFDEHFGSYLEDVDLSLRLSRQGYSNVVVKNSKVIHAKHASSKHLGKYKKYLDLKNWWLVVIKNWSISDVVLNFPMILVERLRNVSGFIKN